MLHIHQSVKKDTDGAVATVGQLNVTPNLATVLPGEVELTFEVRYGNQESIDSFEKEILDWITANYEVEITPGVKKKASKLSENVRGVLKEAASDLIFP